MCFLQIMVIIYNGTVGSFWILIQFLFILSVFSNTSFHSWDRCFRDSSSSSSAVASLPCSSFTSISDCLSTTKSTAGTGTGTWNTFIYGANAETLCPQLVANSRTSLTGNFSSPAWPSPYPPDAVCFYRLQGAPWEGVKLKFLDFDLEPPYSNAGCLSDYLEITTIDVHEQRTSRGRYCGRSIPDSILFLDPTVEFVFRSNSAYHSSGFFAMYEFIDEAYITPPTLNGTSPCGGVITGNGGVIENPGFPHGYSAGLDCLWLIRVPYQHAIYLRMDELDFQGSIANCQRANIGIYDGYEYSLDESLIHKRFCGDLRYYKNEEDRVFLSSRNRILIRFTTTEPSKPVGTSSSESIGFRLIWSDVEFHSVENCTRLNRFPCQESRLCFTKNHIGGASTCPDLRHYCISNQLVCDSVQHCGEGDSSDEQSCYKTPLIVMMVAIPLSILFTGLLVCFCCQKFRRNSNRNNNISMSNTNNNEKPKSVSLCWGIGCYWNNNNRQKKRLKQKKLRIGNVTAVNNVRAGGSFTKHDLFPPFHPEHRLHHLDMAPISITAPSSLTAPCNKHHLAPPESPSDIVSPASGFSDSESDVASSTGGFQNLPPPPSYSFSCPTHGPFRFLIPPTNGGGASLPVLEEEFDYYYDDDDGNDNDEEVLRIQSDDNNTCGEEEEEFGSIMSSQNSDSNGHHNNKKDHHHHHHHQKFHAGKTRSPTDMWRNHQQQQFQRPIHLQLKRNCFQRTDAVWSDNEGKSSVGSSSPIGSICPRCNCSVIPDDSKQSQGGSGINSNQWKNVKDSVVPADGGMAGRLVGVPSLLKRKIPSRDSSLRGGGSSGGGGCVNQFDSGIDTSIENVKVVSFDSSNSVESSINNSDTCGGGNGGGRWRSPSRVTGVSVSFSGGGTNDLGIMSSSPQKGTKSKAITDV